MYFFTLVPFWQTIHMLATQQDSIFTFPDGNLHLCFIEELISYENIGIKEYFKSKFPTFPGSGKKFSKYWDCNKNFKSCKLEWNFLFILLLSNNYWLVKFLQSLQLFSSKTKSSKQIDKQTITVDVICFKVSVKLN